MPIRTGRPPTPAVPVADTSAAPKPVSAPAAAPTTPPPASSTAASFDVTTRTTNPAHLTGDVAPPPPSGPLPPPPVKSLSEVFDALPTTGGGPAGARLLSSNLDSWNARWDMIAGAKTSIDATYFSLERDVFGKAFLGALLEKQLAGVPVRVMTDAMADTVGERGFKMPLRGKDYLQELVNHGGQAWIYHPLWQRPGDALHADYSVLASNHDKILVVDGERGITGGRNIGIDYLTDPKDRKGAWRDMDVALEGRGTAAGLTAGMNAELGQGNVARPVHKDRLGNWAKRDLELIGAAEMMTLWLNDPKLSEAEKATLRAEPAGKKALADGLVERAIARFPHVLPRELQRAPSNGEREALHELATQLVDQLEARGSRQTYLTQRLPEHATEAKILDQTSTAVTRVNGIAPALKDLVNAAQKRIVIENPYVVLTEEMLASLQQASERGVSIDIVTNSPLSTDSAQTQAFFLEDWQAILARCPTARIFVATGDRKFHAKTAMVDGEQCLISTYNLDLLSGYVNSEIAAVVKSKELANDLLKEIDADRADPANGFLEYTIKKDAQGRAVLVDGKPVPVFGPEDHLPAKVLEDYRGRRQLWGHTLRDTLPYLAPLRHPDLEPK